jgi:Spy/CpxP family protein refolding chaperone
MKHISFLITAATAATFCISNPATVRAVDEDKRGDRPHRKELRERFLEGMQELNLTEDQKTQLRKIMEESRPSMEPLTKSLNEERRALMELIRKSPVDETAIRETATKIGSLEGDVAVGRAKIAEKMRAILTPEQAKKFDEMKEKHGGKGPRGHRGPGGPGEPKGVDDAKPGE